jgi:16S rRNA (guanine527-N7)-methyltransferase
MPLAELGAAGRAQIARVLEALGPTEGVPAGAAERLAALCNLVVEWNRRIDLTAARDNDELVDLMVADAAILARAQPPPAERWVDVGSGAGAPGLALCVLAPQLGMTLVEPREKRVAFLRTALGTLDLPNVVVERRRSSELPSAIAEVAVSRATLPPRQWLEEGARLATRAVWVLLARDAPPSLAGWRIDRDEAYRLPLTSAERRIVRFMRAP